MKITGVDTFPLSFPLSEPARDATGSWSSWDTVIVRVTAEDGTAGYGEIGPVHGGGLKIFVDMVDCKLRERLIGENPFDRERICGKLLGHGTDAYAFGRTGAVVSAVAGIDIALWDLSGKLLDTPAYNLMGGRVFSRIPAYASGFFGRGGRPLTPQQCAEEAQRYVDQGFRGVKMKIGFGRRTDLENLAAVRKSIGPDRGIMVDANQGFSFHEVRALAAELSAFDLTFLEEPLPISDLDGMAELVRSSAVPIAAGENYYTRFEFRELFARRAVDIVQPDIIHAGGMGESLIIARMASSYNVPLAPHIHATVGVPASIHLLAASSNTLAAEYITSGGSYLLRRELCGESCMVDADGYVPVPEGPGLGFRINEEAFETYRARGI